MSGSKAETVIADKLYNLHMCDFCSKEIETCEASPVRGHMLQVALDQLIKPEAVIACNRYESPVEVLKKKFH